MTDAEIVKTLATEVMRCVKIVQRLSEEHWALAGDKSNPPFAVFDNEGGPIWLVPSNGGAAFDPITSISDAFQVVEKMRERRYTFSLQTSFPDTPMATKAAFSDSDGGEDFVKVDPITSRAICLAAIAAIGEK